MKIIVTAAGGSGGRFLTEALRLAGHCVIGTDCDARQLPLAITEKTYLVPKAACGAMFVESIVSLTERFGADLIMPQSDAEALALSAAELDLPTLLPSHEAVAVAQDKWASYETWRQAGVPCAETRQVRCCAADVTRALADGMGPKLWLRARAGAGGRASLLLDADKQSRDVAELAALWLDYWGEDLLVSEYLGTDSYCCDIVYRRGSLIAWCGRQRLSWLTPNPSPSGVSGAAGVSVLHQNETILAAAVAAVEALPGVPHGVFAVDFCRPDDERGYMVTEINAGRFGAPSAAFYAHAGYNLAACVPALMGGVVSPIEALRCCPPGPPAYAMLRAPDREPVYLTREEWAAL